jgi:hypothetical protein
LDKGEQDHEHDKQDPGNLGGHESHAGNAEGSCDQGDDQKE